ncbi:uncharacterized protein FSUBG_12621 [Fusarium subglutinans]|uniref:Uncharacterized protein n=1 Tax=Gibberella subglutinans TaxID=42677 RepID=A0A8H5L5C5_GIBSU|nr:uncharacterized protein FSUBG_12621 [Fusarium subglutinans]KAF5584958.1 hypothetical protein FSUBG_12621 [Fusarium subglutinans]
MSSLQSNQGSASVTDKSGTGPSNASLASDTASTKVSGSDPSSTGLTEVSTVAPTKALVETATATITKTSIAITTTTRIGSGTGLSNAAITGIAVSSGVAGAALALCAIVALLYLKRRHHEPAPKTSLEEPPKSSPKNLMVVPGFVGLPTRVLLTGASDSDIKSELGSLGNLIERHVDGHYHRDKISATSDTLHASLRDLHLTEATCSMIARLCIDPNTRYTGIRHLLALVIFSNLDLHTIDSLSLLPPTVKEFSQSRIRAPKQEQDPLSVESQIDALITVLQKALDHFVPRDKGHSLKDQQASLAGVIRECVKFGYEVFSHPSDWEFTFAQEEHGIIVVPGLKQRSSSTGDLYDPPKLVLAPEIVAVPKHYVYNG